MYTFAGESAVDVDALRDRLARMDEPALARFGSAAAYMCSPWANSQDLSVIEGALPELQEPGTE
jgi:hypothetical protein